MRTLDVLALALEALWQQKVRTILTTTGVVLGTIVLVISVSLGQGVQETVVREISRHGDLRTVEVRPGSAKGDVDVPAEAREVHGEMSDERRERIQREMVRRWKRRHQPPPPPAVKLTREKIQELTRLPHVRSATVGDTYSIWTGLGEKGESAVAVSTLLQDEAFRSRLIAGDLFATPDERGVLVSEFLLYNLGVRDDAALQGVIGQKLRLVMRGRLPPPDTLLLMMNVGGARSVLEEAIVTKVLQKLPRLLDKLDPESLHKLDLTPDEKAILERVLARPLDKATKQAEKPIVEEFTIRGVLRTADEKEGAGRWNWIMLDADVVLPPTTAEVVFARLPEFEEHSYRSVLLEVDSLDHVKEVTQQVEAMGFGHYSLMEYVEAERFLYLMIFAGMTLIALVALSVSALGIGNTMLMGVLERVREIGVMKAVGAGEGQIQMLFLIEGLLIGLVGGVIGLGVAYGLSFPGDAWVRSLLSGNTTIKLDQSLFVFPLWLWVGAPLFSCALTTLAAVYPARQAAKVDTVKALRHE